MNRPKTLTTLLVSALLISACSGNNDPETMTSNAELREAQPPALAKSKRWYSETQVTTGKGIYDQNCKVCHGEKAVGSFNWRKRLPDGSWPPPPLNGTAHAWHHDLNFLRNKIAMGASSDGEHMPAFGSTLDKKEIDSVIAYFQSYWSDEIYNIWTESGH